MKNHAIVNYDTKELSLFFKGDKFVFNLNEGDIGEFWYGFKTEEGKIYDVNYGNAEGQDDSVIVYSTIMESDGFLSIDMENYEHIEISSRIGDENNYLNP